ncbi:MAG TPA: PAS domain-containing protein, partial [Chroococcidiopsis sp.]
MREFQMRAERAQAAIALNEAKERLHLAIEGSSIGLWDWSIPTGIVTLNDRWAEMIGYTLEELAPTTIETWRKQVHPDDLSKASQLLEQHFAQAVPTYECELRMQHRLGHWVWLLARGTVVERASDGTPLRMTGTHLDISERKQAELQLSLQNAILERIAKAEPLSDILDALARATEEQLEGGLCSILLHHDGRLYYGAAPHLPAAYNQAIDGLAIGEGAGSCGTAVVRRQPIIVTDIATDPLWPRYKDIALAHGLRACWSVPVIASDGTVLATFAVYHRTIHHPGAREIEVISLVANITKIAIERERNTQALEQLNRELEDRVAQRTVALQRSEASLREAQQVARLGSWELDAATQKITWSKEIFSIFRLNPQQPEPGYDNLFRYFPADDGARLSRLLERALHHGEPYAADFQIIRADGSSGYIFAKAEVSLDDEGRVNRVFGIAMDISDQKTIQAALQRSEERAHATLLALPDLVFRVNRAGQYVDFMVSPPGRNLLNPEEAIGKTVDEVFPSHLVVTNGVSKFGTIQKALETQSVHSYEQQVWINGSLRYEEVRIAPCGEDEVVFFVRDISDRKQAEAQLQQTNAELARATRLKDEFLANMSHELRTPLTSILGMTDVLKEEIFGDLNEKQQQYLEVVAQSGRHLLSLINDILDLAKIESGKLELQRSPILVPVLCSASVSFVKQLAHQKNIKLASYLPDEEIGEIYVDELRIKQALINLLSNAVKFTPPDGQVTLEVTCDRAQSLLQFHVIDTGIGIAAEDMPKLFQSFMQIDSRLNRQYNGTGLGLSLVKRIVELHQGSVT